MIPATAITVKPARDVKPGDVGFYLAPEPIPFVAGPVQNGVLCVATFSPDKVRVREFREIYGPALIIRGAEIEVDPLSARKASLGSVSGCPVFAGANRYLEVDDDMVLYQIALGHVDEAASGDRIAFERWRIVLRHDGTAFEILSR